MSCPICLEDFKIPVCPPCGHLHCQDCLAGYIDTQPNPTSIACPSCKVRFSLVTLDQTWVPAKYHPFLQTCIRRVYLPQELSAAQNKIEELGRELDASRTTDRRLQQSVAQQQKIINSLSESEREARLAVQKVREGELENQRMLRESAEWGKQRLIEEKRAHAVSQGNAKMWEVQAAAYKRDVAARDSEIRRLTALLRSRVMNDAVASNPQNSASTFAEKTSSILHSGAVPLVQEHSVSNEVPVPSPSPLAAPAVLRFGGNSTFNNVFNFSSQGEGASEGLAQPIFQFGPSTAGYPPFRFGQGSPR